MHTHSSSSPGPSLARQLALAAILIAVGNIASRLIGLVREAVIAGMFARGEGVAAFTAASAIPTMVYDLLINGAISAALVPVLSEYADGDAQEFWRVASTIINLALLVTAGVVAVLIWQAPAAVPILAGGFDPQLLGLTVLMSELMLPAVILMALSGLITAILYARRQFLLPAFTTSAYNLGIILGALLLTPLFGVLSLVVGVLLGALLQVLLQLPGLRGAVYRPYLELRHPAVRRILWLYAPVALGIGFSTIQVVLDRRLASGLEASVLPTMRYATTLIQFPLGLVAAAVSFAVLPTLSRQAGANDDDAFRRTLAMGINVVLLLILPATLGLAALAGPIVELLYQRNAFGAQDSAATATALLLYLPGLPAAAVDQMLLFAFYARRRTLAPNLVQGAAVALYATTALLLLWGAGLGIEALILGNSVQWVGHVLIMIILSRGLVNLGGLQIGATLLKCGLAALMMAGMVWGMAQVLVPFGVLVQIGVAGLIGALGYFGLCLALRVEALTFVAAAVRRRMGR